MRRRWIWPLAALAVALAVLWIDGRLTPARRTTDLRSVLKPVPLRDVPMTIRPDKPPAAPPAMASDLPPSR